MSEHNGIPYERERLAVNAYLSSFYSGRERQFDMGQSASTTYGGARDIYRAVGYPGTLGWTDYYGRYRRQDIARRVVDAQPDDTWRRPPTVLDGTTKDKSRNNTRFVKAWEAMVTNLNLVGDDPEIDERSVWHHFHQADRYAGIHWYSTIVLGFANGTLDQPLTKGAGGRLLYTNVLLQEQAQIHDTDLVRDPTSPRFGRPEQYWVDFGDGQGRRAVHYTRVIHVAEGGQLYGTPRMECVYNRLIDVEKLLAASGEAGWRSILRRIIFSTRDGYRLAEATVTQSQVDELLHGFRTAMEVEGMDVTALGGEVLDPSGPIDKQVDFIAGGTGIPQRKLLGSERGELASTQDDENWNDIIIMRRLMFAEPVILRPFIRRLIWAGVLPPPSTGSIFVDWPSLYEMDDQEHAQIALTYAQVAEKMASPGIERAVVPSKFLKFFVRNLPPDAIPSEEDRLRMEAEAMGAEEGENDDGRPTSAR